MENSVSKCLNLLYLHILRTEVTSVLYAITWGGMQSVISMQSHGVQSVLSMQSSGVQSVLYAITWGAICAIYAIT